MEDKVNAAAVVCSCGHSLAVHHHAKSCTAQDERFRFCRCELFREARSIARQLNEEEEIQVMAKEKGRKVVLFEVTSKKADELLAKDNQTNTAIFYRVLVAKGEAMTRAAIYEASKSKCESGAAWERLGNQTHDTLARLRKGGFVKRIETREAVAAKPKVERKQRTAKPKKVAAKKPNSSPPDVTDKDIPMEATA